MDKKQSLNLVTFPKPYYCTMVAGCFSFSSFHVMLCSRDSELGTRSPAVTCSDCSLGIPPFTKIEWQPAPGASFAPESSKCRWTLAQRPNQHIAASVFSARCACSSVLAQGAVPYKKNYSSIPSNLWIHVWNIKYR